MKILAEINCCEGMDINGRTIERTAVRGVVLRGRDLLMIYSSNAGDYKFPGGGVSAGESHEAALRREVQEECGMLLARVGNEIGAVVEYNIPMEEDCDVFKMTSHYYQCEVENGLGVQKLEDYEQELGFKPIWIEIEKAIEINQSLLDSDTSPR